MAIPFARSSTRPPIFYGWYIVGVALVAQFVAAGTQAYAASVFLSPMTLDLGWSRGEYSAVQTVSTVIMGGVGLIIGSLIDRQGPRWLMFGGGVICGLCLILTAQVDTLWQFYLIRGVGQTVGNAMLGNLVVNVTLAKWFVARRGMAVAIASIGVSLGGVLMTPVAAWWVEDFGWRTAWVLLGITVWVLILPAAFVIRRRPEDFGMHPDGMNPEQARAWSALRNRISAVSEVQWTRHDAIRTSTIWFVILAYGVGNIGMMAMLIHLLPFLTDHGWSPGQAAMLYSVQAWSALLSKPMWGVLMDRIHARHLSAFGFVVSGISLLLLIPAVESGSPWMIGLILVFYGLGIGGTVPLQETVWGSYFGRLHLGQIRSVAMPFSIIFSAVGPILAGSLFDRTGGYTASLIVFAAFNVLGFVFIIMARPPKPPAPKVVVEPSANAVRAH